LFAGGGGAASFVAAAAAEVPTREAVSVAVAVAIVVFPTTVLSVTRAESSAVESSAVDDDARLSAVDDDARSSWVVKGIGVARTVKAEEKRRAKVVNCIVKELKRYDIR